MQENSVVAYVRIADVKHPIPSNESNSRGEPTFNVKAIGHTICGSMRDPNTGSYSNETREMDLIFTGITVRQQQFIARGSDIFINGASVISYMTPVIYNKSILGCISETGEAKDASDIINWLTSKLSSVEDLTPAQRGALLNLIPSQRRITIVRVKTGQWTIKATTNQINNGISIDGTSEDFGGI